MDRFNKCLFQALSALLVLYNKKHGIRTSGLQFLFWLLFGLCGAAQFRTEVRGTQKEEGKSDYYNVSYMIFYPLCLAMFILNCLADQAPRHSNYPKADVSKHFLFLLSNQK